MADLGRWLSGGYRIEGEPAEPAPPETDEADEDPDGSDS